MNKAFLFPLMLLVISACNSKIHKNIGITKTLPDATQVQTIKNLELPPHFEQELEKTNGANNSPATE